MGRLVTQHLMAKHRGEPASFEEQFGIAPGLVFPRGRTRSVDHAWRSLKLAMRRYGSEPSELTASALDTASRAMQEARRLTVRAPR